MKKTLLVLTATAMLAMTACAGKTAAPAATTAAQTTAAQTTAAPATTAAPETKAPETTAAPTTAAPETTAAQMAGMANPWTTIDPSEMAPAIGYNLKVPEGAENVECMVMKDQGMGEIRFTKDGTDFVARIQSTPEYEDISGLYYDWGEEQVTEIGYLECHTFRHKEEKETIDLCLWYDRVPGIMYSLSAKAPDLDGFDILAYVEQVYEPMQGES